MNQFRKIETVRLSAGFFFYFLFTQTTNMEIFLIYFLNLLNLKARKLFYAKNIREAFEPLAYVPKFTPMGLFANYTLFLPEIGMKLEYSQQIVAKHSNIKFHEYPSRESELFHADRHDEAKSRFRNSVNESKKSLTFQGNNTFLSVCSINFREILVTNGNRG
jgi:hypothetical protein